MTRILSCLTAVLLAGGLTAVPNAFAQKSRGAKRGASAVLSRGLNLYEAKEYEGASIELFKVVEGETADSEADRQKAEFFIGKTLYNMNFLSASVAFFDRVVEHGPSHPYYSETLRWLASLATELADPSPVIDRIGNYQQSELEQPALEPVRDQLYFLLGRSFYRQGDFDRAVQLFRLVPKNSSVYVRAKLFEGATFVRENKGKEAGEAFKSVLRATIDESDDESKRFTDIAHLSLARTFYSVGQFDSAVKYYDKVSTNSRDWANSLFESSWANFMLQAKGYPKALGNIHTLQSPYFEDFVSPESLAEALTVRATIFYYNCLYDRAAQAIEVFNAKVPPLTKDLKDLYAATDDSTEFYELAVRILSDKSGIAENLARAAKAALSDLSLRRKFEYVSQLEEELERFDAAEAAWKQTGVANAVYTDLSLQQSLVVNEAGELARTRIKRLVGELSTLTTRTIKIEYEILQGEKGALRQEIVSEQQADRSVSEREVGNVVVDDEHQRWSFDGEWWRDELGYYRVQLKNRCQAGAPKSVPDESDI